MPRFGWVYNLGEKKSFELYFMNKHRTI